MTTMKVKRRRYKKCVIKRKFEFENYKNCLEATQLYNKINCLKKNKIDVESLIENHKYFIINNRLIIKSQ